MNGTAPDADRRIQGRDDHFCFGCGALNPHGLHLVFYPREDNRGVWSPWTPEQVHEGYTGIVHGGIISAVLDEVMAWSLYQRQIWAVTAKMELAFRKPVEVGVSTRAIGQIDADRGRVIEMSAQLRRVADDTLLAGATATFIKVPEQQAREWQAKYLRDRPVQTP
ncbi:MAG TPA: PaaI family thioesterase [Thermomicrobiales bacterium]|jgi:acyl-coenzyme A thioesterase PaaI-like protein|nr:PaaI family thioesterase [Thermomicrobiales bacterium]